MPGKVYQGRFLRRQAEPVTLTTTGGDLFPQGPVCRTGFGIGLGGIMRAGPWRAPPPADDNTYLDRRLTRKVSTELLVTPLLFCR
jgi:hypothetical protein